MTEDYEISLSTMSSKHPSMAPGFQEGQFQHASADQTSAGSQLYLISPTSQTTKPGGGGALWEETTQGHKYQYH